MIYRVLLYVGYNEAWFDFDNMIEARDFSRQILVHQSENEDTRKKYSVTIKVIDPNIAIEEEVEE